MHIWISYVGHSSIQCWLVEGGNSVNTVRSQWVNEATVKLETFCGGDDTGLLTLDIDCCDGITMGVPDVYCTAQVPIKWPEIQGNWRLHPLLLYDMIKSHGVPNHMGVTIPLDHNLNIDLWRYYEFLFANCKLTDFLVFGWPVNYRAWYIPVVADSNHVLALGFPPTYRSIYRLSWNVGKCPGL